MFDVWRYAIRFLVGNENVVQTLVDDKNRGKLGLWAVSWIAIIEAVLTLMTEKSIVTALLTGIIVASSILIGGIVIMELTRLFCGSDRRMLWVALSVLFTLGLGIYAVGTLGSTVLAGYATLILPHVGVGFTTSPLDALKAIFLSLVGLILALLGVAFAMWGLFLQIKYLSFVLVRSRLHVAAAYTGSIILAFLAVFFGTVIATVIGRSV